MTPLTPFEQTGEQTTLARERAFLDQIVDETQNVKTVTIGKSHNGHPLQVAQIGSGKPGLLIVAAQHGDETSSREAALALIRDLAYGEIPTPTHAVMVVATANPDGVDAGERQNGNGDDINRSHLDQSSPEARALASLINSADPKLVFDAHEKHDDKTIIDFKAFEYVTAPSLKATGTAVKSFLQNLFGANSTDHPVNGHEGTLLNASNWRGIAACLGEVTRQADLEDRVDWYAVCMRELVTYVDESEAGLHAAKVGARRFYSETGFMAHADYYGYESGWLEPALGYLVPVSAERTLSLLGVESFSTDDVSRVYVPMSQSSSMFLPMLLDPRAPRPAFAATPVFWGDEPPIDFLSKPDPLRLPTRLRLGGQEPRRLITKEGVVWGA